MDTSQTKPNDPAGQPPSAASAPHLPQPIQPLTHVGNHTDGSVPHPLDQQVQGPSTIPQQHVVPQPVNEHASSMQNPTPSDMASIHDALQSSATHPSQMPHQDTVSSVHQPEVPVHENNQPIPHDPSAILSTTSVASHEVNTLENLHQPATPAQEMHPNVMPSMLQHDQPHISTEPHIPQQEVVSNPEPVSHRVAQMQQSPEEQQPVHAEGSSVPPVPPSSGKKESIGEERSFAPILKILIGIALFFVVGGGLLLFLFSLFSKGSSGKVTLQYWGLWEDASVMQPIINDFERANPTITVQYIKQDPTDYTSRLLTRIQNGSGPDIFRFHPSWLPMLQPVLLPLPESVITKQQFTQEYYPVMQKDLTKNGAIYGIPLYIDTLALFTNDAILKKASISAPTNWTDFVNDTRSLTTKDATGKIQVAGAAIGTFNNILHAPDLVSLLFLQNGVDMSNIGNSKKNISDALSFYTSFASGNSNVWDMTLDPSLVAFSKGNAAMFFGYSWDIFSIKALNPSLAFSVNPVPHLPGRNMTIASYWAEGVSVKSKNQAAAILFMKYLTQKETLQKLYTEEAKTRLFGELYPRSDMASLLTSNPLIAPFVTQAPTAVSSLFVGETKDQAYNAPMNQYLGNAVNAVLNSNTSAPSAVDPLVSGVSQIVQQYAPKTTQ